MALDVDGVNEAQTKLLESALTLFSQKGYEGTSIREIIKGATVTRPVLYYYFENKEDLFCKLVDIWYAKFIEELETVAAEERAGNSKACLKEVMRRSFRQTEERLEAVRLLLQVFFAPPEQVPPLDRLKLVRRRFRVIEAIMQDGLDKDELRGGDAQSLALVFLGILDVYVMTKANRPETRLTDELADNLVDMFLVGAGHEAAVDGFLVSPFLAEAGQL